MKLILTPRTTLTTAMAALCLTSLTAYAAVSSEEAHKLSTTLTPLGAERAGNKEGTIPAWTGTPIAYPNYKLGGPRPDPFASDKPQFSITAKNVDQYADKLTDGTKALFKKFPDSYRIDVYPTRRTAIAPQWVYDNTAKNATRAKLSGSSGLLVSGAFGGVPFPIPQNGAEVMWNHLLRWRGTDIRTTNSGYLTNTAQQRTLISIVTTEVSMPYYYKESSLEEFEKTSDYWKIFLTTTAPPLRAGELIVGRENIDGDKTQVWLYFTGQRRTRKVPQACCDTPQTSTGGLMSFDEIFLFTGRMDRFDWKLLGKKEVYVPYNANGLPAAKDEDVMLAKHVNPDKLRWELHRVWVVEATLRAGQRHTSPRSRYYVDEDSWHTLLADRWDAQDQLVRTMWAPLLALPDIPAATTGIFGFNDLLSGAWFISGLAPAGKGQYEVLPRLKDSVFTPDAMAGEGVR